MAKRNRTKAVSDPEGTDPPQEQAPEETPHHNDEEPGGGHSPFAVTPPPRPTEVPEGPRKAWSSTTRPLIRMPSPLGNRGKGPRTHSSTPDSWEQPRHHDEDGDDRSLERFRPYSPPWRGRNDEERGIVIDDTEDVALKRGHEAMNRRSERYARELQEREYAGGEDDYWSRERDQNPQGRPEGSSAPARREQATKAAEVPQAEHRELHEKYEQLLREREKERKAFLEDIVGNLDILGQQVAANLDGAIDAMKRSSKVAETAEVHIASLKQLRESIAARMGIPGNDESTPSGDSNPGIARLREEDKRSAAESAETLRKLAERKRLRESGVPVNVREAAAMREKRKRKDARAPGPEYREDDRDSDSADERLRLLYRSDRPQRRSKYHRFASVESRHQVSRGNERLESERFAENRYSLDSRPGRNRVFTQGGEDNVSFALKQAFVTKQTAALRPERMPLGKMGIKIEAPAPYSGSSDLSVFEEWLTQLLAWLQIQQLDVL